MRIIKVIFQIVLVSILLASCQKESRVSYSKTTMEEMAGALEQGDALNQSIIARKRLAPPVSVTNSLLPKLDIDLPSDASQERIVSRFDIAVKEVPARQFFMGLVAGTPYSMVVSPKVEGTISLNLKNVSIAEALKATYDAYGYVYEKTAYGFKVAPSGLKTKVFHVNYLNVKRQGQSMTRVTSGSLSEGDSGSGSSGSGSSSSSSSSSSGSGSSSSSSSSDFTSSVVGTDSVSDFWPELEQTLLSVVGEEEGRSVVVSPQAGLVVVRAYPDELDAVDELLTQTERNLTRQVILETKIIEVILNDSFQAGINWDYLGGTTVTARHGGLLSSVNDLAESFSFPKGTESGVNSDVGGIFGFTTKLGNFQSIVKLLSNQGNVQVLSSPRISTVNNQKAVIKVGGDEFFVTELSGSTSAPAAGAAVASQDISVTPFFSGISLDVTPHISRDGSVILHVHPTISEVTEGRKDVIVNGVTTTIPLAKSSVRESDNIVRAENGQVIVIGGLMKTVTNEQLASTPGLGKIPVIGSLFRRTMQVAQKSELIILLRPIVVDDNTWQRSIRDAGDRFDKVTKGFHVGDKGDIFKPVPEIGQFKKAIRRFR